jgi:hypothetical protein
MIKTELVSSNAFFNRLAIEVLPEALPPAIPMITLRRIRLSSL